VVGGKTLILPGLRRLFRQRDLWLPQEVTLVQLCRPVGLLGRRETESTPDERGQCLHGGGGGGVVGCWRCWTRGGAQVGGGGRERATLVMRVRFSLRE